MRRELILSLLSLLAMASCHNPKVAADDEDGDNADSTGVALDTLHLFSEDNEIPETIDELFDDFFFTFATDERFQMNRIAFPLRCDDEEETMRITRSDWQNLNSFISQDYYAVIYDEEHDLQMIRDTTVNKVDVEWIYLDDGYVEKYNFRRIEGKWMLCNIKKLRVSEHPNVSFIHFYTEFVSDSATQRSCLDAPMLLTITPEEPDGEAVTELVSADDWFEMTKDMPVPSDYIVNIDYGQRITSTENKTILLEGASNDLTLKYHFEIKNGAWKLMEIEI